MLKIDGFDCCIIGVASTMGQEDVLAYSVTSILTKLMVDLDCPFDEAVEYFEFNIAGAYMGEGTPCFIEPYDPDAYHDELPEQKDGHNGPL